MPVVDTPQDMIMPYNYRGSLLTCAQSVSAALAKPWPTDTPVTLMTWEGGREGGREGRREGGGRGREKGREGRRGEGGREGRGEGGGKERGREGRERGGRWEGKREGGRGEQDSLYSRRGEDEDLQRWPELCVWMEKEQTERGEGRKGGRKRKKSIDSHQSDNV